MAGSAGPGVGYSGGRVCGTSRRATYLRRLFGEHLEAELAALAALGQD